PGDELGYKPWELGRLGPDEVDALITTELDDTQLNDLILHMGVGFNPELTRRSSFTSELFPMAPYICVSLTEDFHTYAERVAVIESAKRAEQIARDHRSIPARLSPLWIWMAGFHYLCGRECLIQMGALRPDERAKEIRSVVDFWRRLTLAHRADGALNNKDAGDTNPYLPDSLVRRYDRERTALDDESRAVFRRLNATLAGYAFLYYTDSRVGIYDSGPYDLDGDRLLVIRDYLQLGRSAFPWSEVTDVPYDNLSIGMVVPKGKVSIEINDWGTSFTEPTELGDIVTDVAVYARRGDELVALPAGEWAALTKAYSKTHMRLYQHFARMPRRDKILSAATMYCWGLIPFADDAGVTDKIDWEISGETLRYYPEPFDDDATAGGIFAGALITHDRPSAFSPIG
ncbi:MAG: PEP-utilizing enzyme, partial [Acidimicrobiia bacterium]